MSCVPLNSDGSELDLSLGLVFAVVCPSMARSRLNSLPARVQRSPIDREGCEVELAAHAMSCVSLNLDGE